MTLNKEERDAIVIYRIEKAYITLEEAEGNLNMGFWNTAANRLYYAAYYAVTALLIHNKSEAQTHNGVITLFNLHFVSKGIISKEAGRLYGQLFDLRQKGDYNDLYRTTQDDVRPLFEPTRVLIQGIRDLIEN